MAAVRLIAEAYDTLIAWPDRPDFLDHELATGRLLVAQSAGEVIAFGGVLPRGGVTHLADLFVRQQYRGVGVGRRLLSALFSQSGHRVTFASSDPRAVPLYVRFGMRPVAPLLYLRGEVEALDPRRSRTRLVQAGLDQLAGLDAEVSGRRRRADHAFLMSLPTSRAVGVTQEAAVIGYGHVRSAVDAQDGATTAFVGPAGSLTIDAAEATVLALIAAAGEGAQRVELALFGPHPALPVLLALGFRVIDADTFMSSRLELPDMQRYVPSAELG